MTHRADKAQEIYQQFRQEVWLASTITHPCIVRLFGCSLTPCTLLMELVTEGTLHDFLFESKKELNIHMIVSCILT